MKIAVKSLYIVLAYLFLLIVSSLIASNEMGALKEGFYIIFYSFYTFIYILLSIKDGFPTTITDVSNTLFLTYMLIGFVFYFTLLFISHFYLFKFIVNKMWLMIALTLLNLFFIFLYLFFELSVIGFATV